MSQSKMKYLIQELMSSLQLNENTEGNVEIISKNLVLTNTEFKRIPKATFKNMVQSTVSEIAKERAQDAASANAVTERKSAPATPQATSTGPPKGLTSGIKRKRTTSLKGKSDIEQLESQTAMLKGGDSRPSVRLSDLAGLESTIQTVKELIFYPVQLPTLYKQLGIQPPSGLLLHGPSGCGKTTLAMAIGGELNLPFFKVSGPELIGGTSGESETRIRELFDTALRHAPSIVFIDAIDVIAGKREASHRGMDRRVVAQLFDCIDDIRNMGKLGYSSGDNNKVNIVDQIVESSGIPPLGEESGTDVRPIGEPVPLLSTLSTPEPEDTRKHVIFIAATDKPDSVDPGVRGRFSKELALPVPDAKARTLILQLATGQMTVDEDVDFESLGKSTPGFVGADLHALCSEAGIIAVKRIVSGFSLPDDCGGVSLPELIERKIKQHSACANGDVLMENAFSKEETNSAMDVDKSVLSEVVESNFNVTMADFMLATKSIQPSAKREGFAVVPDVTWNDVGALSSVREELLHNVIEPISHPERFVQLGLEVPAGVLFFGPPGETVMSCLY